MNLKPIFMSMFAIAALASCNNEDEIPGGIQNETAKSWIGVKVALPASSFTRAADAIDDTAEELETKIKTIRLYYKKADGTVGDIATTFNVDTDFVKDPESGLYTASTAAEIPVAKGTSVELYAAVNTPTSPVLRPNWFNFRGTAADPDVNYWTAQSSQLSNETTGFTMTGSASGVTFEKKEEATVAGATHAKVTLVRNVAKVLVTASETGIDPTQDFDENNSNGSSGKFQANTLKWTIGNDNKKLFLLADTDGKDPNWKALTKDGLTDEELEKELEKEYENRTPKTYSMAVPQYGTPSATGYQGATSYVQYCNENTNEVYQYGNTSFISVQAVFVPKLIVETVTKDSENKIVMKAVDNTKGKATFYYYSAELKYLTEDAYNQAIAAGLLKTDFIGPYTNGECYYFVPIKNTEGKIGVLRNSYYTMRIKSLKAPGDPTPNPGPPVDPVESKSYIAVDFEVAKWVSQSMGDLDLE